MSMVQSSLTAVPWSTMPPGKRQPERFCSHEGKAQGIASAFTGGENIELSCLFKFGPRHPAMRHRLDAEHMRGRALVPPDLQIRQGFGAEADRQCLATDRGDRAEPDGG